MKQDKNPIKVALDQLFCTYEKIRVFIKLALTVPNQRQTIKETKKHLRLHLPEFLKHEPLFGITPSSISAMNDLQLKTARDKCRQNNSLQPIQRHLVIIHELSRTGAPMAALMLAKTLKKTADNQVCLLTLKDGPMREEFEQAGINVLTHFEVPDSKSIFVEFVNDFDMLFACSVCWDVLRIIGDIKIPVIWWVHEVITHPIELKRIEVFISHVDLLLAGSPLVTATFTGNLSPKRIQPLLYGLPPIQKPKRIHNTGVVTFALLGSICERKGTDIFIDAIQRLPSEIRTQARFIIIGQNDDNVIFKKLTQAVDEYDEIELYDNMPFKQLVEAYDGFDVVVSASRNDPMPIVMTYAFMFSKLCLSSDTTGTALLMKNMESGLIFKNEDATDLAKKMTYAINNRLECKKMAEDGKKIYQDHFSMNNFEKSIHQVTNHFINENK